MIEDPQFAIYLYHWLQQEIAALENTDPYLSYTPCSFM